jgi:outer membrane protein OmpA-like peptidoglycan-associated protein
LGLGAILAWAVFDVVPGVERGILNGVQKAISPIVTSPVMVSVHGRTTTITGDTASESERLALLTAIEESQGVSTVVDRLTLKAGASGSATSSAGASAQPDTPTMATGDIDRSTDGDNMAPPAPPSPTTQENLALAELPDEAPSDFAPIDAPPVSAPLAGESASNEGPTSEAPTNESAPAPMPALSMSLSDNALTLEGKLDPSVDIATLIEPALKAFNPSYLTNLIDTTEATADAAWLKPLTALLPGISALADPSIKITDRQITLAGIAPSREIHDEIVSTALQALGEYSLVERITVASTDAPAAPQSDQDQTVALAPDMAAEDQPAASPDRAGENTTVAIYNALQELEDRRILFAPSSVNLVDGSAERLTAIAELFNRFPDVKIEIEGHTDTSGNADANMRLSQQRAVAVREALVERGVERDRLVAYGYGEGVPLVDNATPEGRARNRRIEFRFPTSGS